MPLHYSRIAPDLSKRVSTGSPVHLPYLSTPLAQPSGPWTRAGFQTSECTGESDERAAAPQACVRSRWRVAQRAPNTTTGAGSRLAWRHVDTRRMRRACCPEQRTGGAFKRASGSRSTPRAARMSSSSWRLHLPQMVSCVARFPLCWRLEARAAAAPPPSCSRRRRHHRRRCARLHIAGRCCHAYLKHIHAAPTATTAEHTATALGPPSPPPPSAPPGSTLLPSPPLPA